MNKASILVLTGPNADPDSLKALNAVATKRNLYLSVLVIGRLPEIPIYATGMGDFAGSADYERWQKDVAQEKAGLRAAAEKLNQALSEDQVTSTVSILTADASSLADALARHALTTDVVMTLDDIRSDKDLFYQVLTAALFRSPAATLLNGLKTEAPLCPDHVLVAWNSGIQASRAIRAAMPILRTAREVTIALFDPVMTTQGDGENPGSDVAYWLSHQGCNVSVQQYPSGGLEIGECLMLRAKETQADMIVMGAYDHSRMRQIIFGGTTRSMVEQTSMPVFLAH